MSIAIPSIAEIRAALQPLTLKQIDTLGELSGVPAPTIAKIRRGETGNPGTETCRKFLPYIDAARAMTALQAPAQSLPELVGTPGAPEPRLQTLTDQAQEG